MGTISDALRPLADAYLASFPSREDRRGFLDTARNALSYVDAFKEMPDRKRRALIAGPVETDAQEQAIFSLLLLTAVHLTKRAPDQTTASGSIPPPFRRQVELVSLILKGLDPDIGKAELIAIERDLLKRCKALAAANASKQNKINRQKLGDDAEDIRRRKEVTEILRTIERKNLRKNDRARYALQRLPLRDRIWKTPNALIKWAHRRGIAI